MGLKPTLKLFFARIAPGLLRSPRMGRAVAGSPRRSSDVAVIWIPFYGTAVADKLVYRDVGDPGHVLDHVSSPGARRRRQMVLLLRMQEARRLLKGLGTHGKWVHQGAGGGWTNGPCSLR